MKKVFDRIKVKDITLLLDDKAKDLLIEKGYDPAYGARPMRRAVERYLEDPMAEEILRGAIKPGDTAQVSAENGKLTFRVPESATEEPAGTS
jgi:ATP-dependent Clp protease ATP-binding subunit ClpC